MSKDILKKKIHEIIDTIDDEEALNLLMEDAVYYSVTKAEYETDHLTETQWADIEKARKQIEQGKYKTYTDVKQHFAQWLMK